MFDVFARHHLEVLDAGDLDSVVELEEVAAFVFIPDRDVVLETKSLFTGDHLNVHSIVVLGVCVLDPQRASEVNNPVFQTNGLVGILLEVSLQHAEKQGRVGVEVGVGERKLVDGLEELVLSLHRE